MAKKWNCDQDQKNLKIPPAAMAIVRRGVPYDAVNKKGYEPITRYLDQNLTLFSFLNSLIYELLRFLCYLYVKSILYLMHIIKIV